MFFFSSRRRHTRCLSDWSSDVCSSDLRRPSAARGPFGAKGVGELPMDGGAPATAQAVENATGIPVEEIPATPEKLLLASSSPVGAALCGRPGWGGGANGKNAASEKTGRPHRAAPTENEVLP